MRRVAITPADRFRRLVVVTDVAPNLPPEVRHGGEDAAGEQIPFDFGEPELDLVEPRGIGWGEVQMHRRTFEHERAHRLCLVRRQVVGDYWISRPRGWLDPMSP